MIKAYLNLLPMFQFNIYIASYTYYPPLKARMYFRVILLTSKLRRPPCEKGTRGASRGAEGGVYWPVYICHRLQRRRRRRTEYTWGRRRWWAGARWLLTQSNTNTQPWVTMSAADTCEYLLKSFQHICVSANGWSLGICLLSLSALP